MKYRNLTAVTIVVLVMLVSCKSEGQKIPDIEQKNNCFNDKLEALKSQKIYTEVMAAFIDTFQVLKIGTKIFGSEKVVSNKVDEAIFFNEQKTECLLLVLQKLNVENITFGEVRVVRGRYFDGKWIFKPSMSFVLDRDYFKAYKENSFEMISKLGRYSVLTEGETTKEGCEIDDEHWFKLMPTD